MREELKTSKDEVYITCEYLEDKRYLYANWVGTYLPTEDVKKGTLLVLEMIKKYSVEYLINDNRELNGVWDEANDFIKETWMPQAIQAGLKKFAHILSQDLYAQLSAEFMEENTKSIEDQFQLRMFETYESAEEWISA